MDAVAESEGSAVRVADAPGRGWRHALAAATVALAVTAAVVVPMGYQARAARQSADTTPVTDPGSVPSQVLGRALTRDQLGTQPARIIRLEPAAEVQVSEVGPAVATERLDGAVVDGDRAWVSVEAPGVLVVRFWLNDPTGSGPPDQVDELAPFTLVSGPLAEGTAPLDVDSLPDGANTVLAELTFDDGSIEYQLATFTVG